MSQNDFTIANQGFPAFRADLNSALQALASNNSGATEPSTMFSNMWWYDSANNIMYIRNEDNDAWIKFAELDQTNDKFVLSGTLQLDDGTVSAPALTFNSDTNMGIYRGGTDILKFVTAGTDRVTIDASGNLTIPSKVSIGTTSATYGLNVGGSGSDVRGIFQGSNPYRLALQNGTSNLVYLGSSGADAFRISNSSGSSVFDIDSSGNLLVGKSSSSGATAGAELRPAGDNIFTRDAGQALTLRRNNNDGDIIQFNKDGTTVGSIGNAGSSELYIQSGSNGTGLSFRGNHIRPRDAGADVDGTVSLGNTSFRYQDLFLSSGIHLGGTGSANKLDDYETGTFNPVYLASTTNPSVTYDTNVRYGAYVKIGRVCYFNFVGIINLIYYLSRYYDNSRIRLRVEEIR